MRDRSNTCLLRARVRTSIVPLTLALTSVAEAVEIAATLTRYSPVLSSAATDLSIRQKLATQDLSDPLAAEANALSLVTACFSQAIVRCRYLRRQHQFLREPDCNALDCWLARLQECTVSAIVATCRSHLLLRIVLMLRVRERCTSFPAEMFAMIYSLGWAWIAAAKSCVLCGSRWWSGTPNADHEFCSH